MASLLDSLNLSFRATREALTPLPGVIEDQELRFTKSLDGLNEHLNKFGNSLEDYRRVIDGTVQAYDRHLAFLDKRAEQVEEQLNRKSDLRLAFNVSVTDSGWWEVQPKIINYGNWSTQYFGFYFDLPKNLLFEGAGYNVDSSASDASHYTYEREKFVGFFSTDSSQRLTLKPNDARFVLRRPPRDGRLHLTYRIVFEHGDHSDSLWLMPATTRPNR